MASITVFGFQDYVIERYENISNNDVDNLHSYYKNRNDVYSIERNYDTTN